MVLRFGARCNSRVRMIINLVIKILIYVKKKSSFNLSRIFFLWTSRVKITFDHYFVNNIKK